MVNIKPLQLNLLGAGITLMLMSAANAPASAQRVIVIDHSNSFGVNQPPAVGSFIYGSPIPTAVPVDPSTGLLPSRSIYPSNYPQVRHNRYNHSTLVNPIIKDSTIVNPVIINNSWRRTPFRGRSKIVNPVIINNSWRRTPFRGRSRVILNHPRYRY